MKTVENELIRVTVTEELWEEFRGTIRHFELEQQLPSGDIRYHDPEKIIRGRVLSRAMEIIGNRSEALLLDNEPFEISDAELKTITRHALMSEWLQNHSKYADGETFCRYISEKHLSTGMQYEIDAAATYASAAINEIDFDALYQRTTKQYTPQRQEKIFSAAREGRRADVSDIVNQAVYWRWYMWDTERRYRHRFDNTKFQIEIKCPDCMPAQIGLCRFEPLPNAQPDIPKF